MAYDDITEQNVYLCTGKPLPSDIKTIVEVLLNTDFATAYKSTILFISLLELYLSSLCSYQGSTNSQGNCSL